ncbi:YciI family protein, partial [Actinomadura adrarensis]
MRFLMMTTETSDEFNAEQAAEMGRFIEEMSKSGALLATGGLDPRGVHVRNSGGKVTVTDGPFTEAKEH